MLLKNIGDTAGGTPLAHGRVRAIWRVGPNPRGASQSAFMLSTMNAVRIHGRGGLEFLKSEDAPIPQLAAGDVLVRVRRTGKLQSP